MRLVYWIRRLQVELVLFLWSKAPIRTRVITLGDDGTIQQRFLWLKPRCGVWKTTAGEVLVATKRDIYFYFRLHLLAIPSIFYRNNEAFPLSF